MVNLTFSVCVFELKREQESPIQLDKYKNNLSKPELTKEATQH